MNHWPRALARAQGFKLTRPGNLNLNLNLSLNLYLNVNVNVDHWHWQARQAGSWSALASLRPTQVTSATLAP